MNKLHSFKPRLPLIMILLCTYIPSFSQENYSDFKSRLSHNYENWSNKQDWQHNYFEWGIERGKEYQAWLAQSGLPDDLDGVNMGFDDVFMNSPNGNQIIDSLKAQIAFLQQNNTQAQNDKQESLDKLQSEIGRLSVQNQQVNQKIEIRESLGNFKIWAIVIGVSYYRKKQIRLKYCDDDAYKIYAFLKSPEGGALPDNQIKLFIDEDAKSKEIESSISDFTQKAGPDDVFFFYFSGHGTITSLIAEDFDFKETSEGKISHAFLSERVKNCKAKLSLCIIDACHSGSIAQRVENEKPVVNGKYVVSGQDDAPAGFRSIASLESTTQFYQSLSDAEKGSVYILSSKGEEYSLEVSGKRQGVFSYYFINGLMGAADYNSDKIISVTESFDYTRKRVIAYTKNAQNPIITGKYSHTLPIAVVRRD